MEGNKIDPTFSQFSHLNDVNYVGKIKKSYSPQEYLELSANYPLTGIKNFVKKTPFKEWLNIRNKK
jgi:hypothetical protein